MYMEQKADRKAASQNKLFHSISGATLNSLVFLIYPTENMDSKLIKLLQPFGG